MTKKLAKIKYLPNNFQIIDKGDHVICAISKKIIPLEMFTSNDQKFFFHTYLIAVDSEFIPRLNSEHSGYCWTAFECWPKNLHMGLRNTLNNKSIKGKLQTILDLIV